MHVLIIISKLRRPRWMVLPMLIIAAAYLSLAKVPKISEPLPVREKRIVLDASCLMVALLLGYRLFLNFANTEGIAHIQLETELALAHRLQKTLGADVFLPWNRLGILRANNSERRGWRRSGGSRR